MTGDNKNFILAIVLSMAIIAGWQYFYVAPMMEEKNTQTEAGGTAGTDGTTSPTTTTTAPGTGTTPAVALTRDEAIAQSPRIKLETPTLEGSINLKGAAIDDVRLKNYRETIDTSSPTITFLSPSGAPGALFAEHGWTAPAGVQVKVPQPDTLWTAPANAALTPSAPLTLTWDNGAGLVFTRTIAIDDKYMFTVKQEVKNSTAASVSLTPYARVQRQGLPKIEGIWVLYEGPHGVLGGQEQRRDYSELEESKGVIPVPSTGGWIGFTDKYWAISLIPDQKSEITGEFFHQKNDRYELFQTDYIAKDPVAGSGWRRAAGYESHMFAGAKIGRHGGGLQ